MTEYVVRLHLRLEILATEKSNLVSWAFNWESLRID